MRAAVAAALGATVLVSFSSCLPGESSAPAQVGPLSLKPGESATYALYTHCGVLEVTINGTPYYADPPLSDGNGNPPPGWGNPQDIGRITLTTPTTADFSDDAGHMAHFTSTPSGPTPSNLMCE